MLTLLGIIGCKYNANYFSQLVTQCELFILVLKKNGPQNHRESDNFGHNHFCQNRIINLGFTKEHYEETTDHLLHYRFTTAYATSADIRKLLSFKRGVNFDITTINFTMNITNVYTLHGSKHHCTQPDLE